MTNQSEQLPVDQPGPAGPQDTGRHEPVYPPRPRRRSRGQRLRTGCGWMILGGFLALMLPVFLAGMGLVLYILFPPAPRNILVLGLDARPGEGYVARTDSIMVVGIHPATLDTSLLSVPRDLFIQVPDYGLQRINTINMLGEMDAPGSGADLAVASVSDNFDIDVPYYVRVNFDAFTAFVDALGGIDINVPSTVIDYQYPTEDFGTTTVQFDAGQQHLNGEQALAYARTRHADDDYRRAERQQQVVIATARTALNPVNWPRIPVALAALWDRIDTNMNPVDMLLVAPPVLLDATAGSVEQQVIDRDFILRSPEGYAVPDYAGLAAWVAANLK